jgi:DNA invertase Pin-like site-specific DNA recombinase
MGTIALVNTDIYHGDFEGIFSELKETPQKVFVDNTSNTSVIGNRMALINVMDYSTKKEIDNLVLLDINHLSTDKVLRSLIKVHLKRKGVTITIVDGGCNGDPEDDVIDGMIGKVVDFSNEITKLRTKKEFGRKKKAGESVGSNPYGYKSDNGFLVKHDEEQKVIKTMRDLRSKGYSYDKVAEYLNGNKIKPRGIRWHKQTIFRTLTRETPKCRT